VNPKPIHSKWGTSAHIYSPGEDRGGEDATVARPSVFRPSILSYANYSRAKGLPCPGLLSSPAAQQGFELWRAAMRWQRAVDAALRPLELTHTQYLVLASTARVIREKGDAVAQLAIAESAELDCATISTLVRKLETHGLLDRDIDAIDGRRWRVVLTQRGRTVLEKATERVDAVAADVAPRRDLARRLGGGARGRGSS
jgi:MarR family transcriptional regulator, organic hydroperoxide resistance regulator